MRFLLDTNILVYFMMDRDSLSRDVKAILTDYDNTFYISAESVKELIVLFRRKKIGSKIWKNASEMVRSLTNDYFFTVMPVDNEVMKTYASLTLNEAEDHNDPSDHVIISQAITLRMPLISSDLKFEFYRNQGLDLIFNAK
ncbi:MAG: type II toxin-antitoxin system VapC family toxin [Prevotella sp.]|jgi:tRNA(fMet)-specific endonuclease VapC